MPDGLTPRATGLVVAVACGLMACVAVLLGGGSDPARPAQATQNPAATLAEQAAPAPPDLRLAAAGTLPALKEPRKARKHRVRKPKRTVRRVVRVAPTVAPTPAPVKPAATAQPAPTAAPRYIPPAPQRTPAPAAPQPTGPNTVPPDSGVFDTTGE